MDRDEPRLVEMNRDWSRFEIAPHTAHVRAGFPIISMFFGAAPATAEQASRAAVAADGSAASAVAARWSRDGGRIRREDSRGPEIAHD